MNEAMLTFWTNDHRKVFMRFVCLEALNAFCHFMDEYGGVEKLEIIPDPPAVLVWYGNGTLVEFIATAKFND